MSTSPVNARKMMQRFVPAGLRPRCATCSHLNSGLDLWLSCGRGGFAVTAYAVCNDWASNKPTALKRSGG